MAFNLVMAVVLANPLASVAETFEYDVLRTLNNSRIMNRAQLFFGQQLLPHLHTLDWGFRISGTVINTKLAGQIVVGLSVGIIGTVTSAVFRIVASNVHV